MFVKTRNQGKLSERLVAVVALIFMKFRAFQKDFIKISWKIALFLFLKGVVQEVLWSSTWLASSGGGRLGV